MKLIFNIFDSIPDSLKLLFACSEELEFNNERYILIDKENIDENEYIKSLLDIAYNQGHDEGYDEGYHNGELDGYEDGDADGYARGCAES